MIRPLFARSPLSRIATFGLASLALVLLAGEARAQSPRTIVIDAGHGGHDRGGVPGQKLGEKDLNLDVAKRLRRVLKADGYRVIMTRESDDFVSLGRRVTIANSYRNAAFVSVHFNSAPRVGANGIETYYYRSGSAELATNIHRNVVAGAPSENRGIRRRSYYVLRRTSIPAVLIECGFLTNPEEARYAARSSYREQLAEEIARGIRGVRAPRAKPLAREAATSPEVLPQPFNGPDYVRAVPRARHSARHSTSSRKKKSSSSSKKKKSSSSKKKKSSSETEEKSTES